MTQEEFHDRLLRRLDVLIRLQLEEASQEEAPSMTSMVERLFDFGLTGSEIASVVGKPLNYVGAIKSQRKAKKGKKK